MYYGVGIVHGDNVRCRSSGVNLPLVAKKMGFRNRGEIYKSFFNLAAYLRQPYREISGFGPSTTR